MSTDWANADGTVASSRQYSTRAGPMFEVVFTYKVNGGWYGGTFNAATPYDEGDTLVVEYDPKDPERNKYVEREKRMHWVYMVLLAAMALLAIWVFLRPRPS